MIIPCFANARRHIRSLTDQFRRRAVVLLYHRVGDGSGDPQLLTVGTERFTQHMAYLSRRYPVLSVERLAQMLVAGDDLPDECVAVTFDDGYSDNLLNARPILEQHGVPATVFMTTGYLDQNREFWWDELERIFLLPSTLPTRCRLRINTQVLDYDLHESVWYSERDAERHRAWNVTRSDSPTARHRIYRELSSRLRSMALPEREATMQALRAWSGVQASARDTHRPLSSGQLRDLRSCRLVTVGAHTVSHPVLSKLSPQQQRTEICQSRDDLATLIGAPVTAFAYPYGAPSDYTAGTVGLVREAGFSFACANYPSVVTKADDPFQLPRFVVRDWGEETFAKVVEGWFDGRRAMVS